MLMFFIGICGPATALAASEEDVIAEVAQQTSDFRFFGSSGATYPVPGGSFKYYGAYGYVNSGWVNFDIDKPVGNTPMQAVIDYETGQLADDANLNIVPMTGYKLGEITFDDYSWGLPNEEVEVWIILPQYLIRVNPFDTGYDQATNLQISKDFALQLMGGLEKAGLLSPAAPDTPIENPADKDATPANGAAATGNPLDEPVKISDTMNIMAVYNGPTAPTTLSINTPHLVTEIHDYHWNNAQGATPGTISLQDQNGKIYGPWQAVGTPGQGGVPNANWFVYPNIVIPAGTYTVIDSDPSTWSQNTDSGGKGMGYVLATPHFETTSGSADSLDKGNQGHSPGGSGWTESPAGVGSVGNIPGPANTTEAVVGVAVPGLIATGLGALAGLGGGGGFAPPGGTPLSPTAGGPSPGVPGVGGSYPRAGTGQPGANQEANYLGRRRRDEEGSTASGIRIDTADMGQGAITISSEDPLIIEMPDKEEIFGTPDSGILIEPLEEKFEVIKPESEISSEDDYDGIIIDTSAFEDNPPTQTDGAPTTGEAGTEAATNPDAQTTGISEASGYDQAGYNQEGYDAEGYDRQGFNQEGFDRAGFDTEGFDKQGFNQEGFDKSGFDAEGFDKEGFNQEGFDKAGFDAEGFDRQGFNQEGFDKAGFDAEGFDKQGFNQEGFDKAGFDAEGFDRQGFNQEGFDKAGFDTEGFDRQGFNQEGFDKAGFDAEGFDKQGFNQEGFDKAGFDAEGFDKQGFNQEGFDKAGFDAEGFDKQGFNQEGFDKAGFDAEGFDKQGFNQEGFDKAGFDAEGFDKQGFNQEGFDKAGFDAEGFDKAGFNKAGFDRDGFDAEGFDKAGFDPEGFDRQGFNKTGFDKEGFNRDGFDQKGFDRAGYDKAGFNLEGFDQEGFDKSGFDQEGFDREGFDKQGFNQEGFDKAGFDAEGFDKAGFNKAGFDRDGFDAEGFDKAGFDPEGYGRNGFNSEGYNREGFDVNGYNAKGFNRSGYNAKGYNAAGYDKEGFNQDGWDKAGYDRSGFNSDGFDREGFDRAGYDKDGYNREGYDREGLEREGYDENGFDKNGYNRNGVDKDGFDREGFDYEGYNRSGYDPWGYNKQGYGKDGYHWSGYTADGYNRDGRHWSENPFEGDGNPFNVAKQDPFGGGEVIPFGAEWKATKPPLGEPYPKTLDKYGAKPWTNEPAPTVPAPEDKVIIGTEEPLDTMKHQGTEKDAPAVPEGQENAAGHVDQPVQKGDSDTFSYTDPKTGKTSTYEYEKGYTGPRQGDTQTLVGKTDGQTYELEFNAVTGKWVNTETGNDFDPDDFERWQNDLAVDKKQAPINSQKMAAGQDANHRPIDETQTQGKTSDNMQQAADEGSIGTPGGSDDVDKATQNLKNDAHNEQGYNKSGFDKDGRDAEGFDIIGLDPQGYDRNGLDLKGCTREQNLGKAIDRIIKDKLELHHFVRNPDWFVRKGWNNTVGWVWNEKLGNWKGGQCGEYVEWGAEWLKDDIKHIYGEDVIIDQILIERNDNYNHVANLIILPNGERKVVDFWEGIQEGKGQVMDEKDWLKKWDDELGKPLWGANKVTRNELQDALLKEIKDAGDTEKGIAKFLHYHKKFAPSKYKSAQLIAKSYMKDPWGDPDGSSTGKF